MSIVLLSKSSVKDTSFKQSLALKPLGDLTLPIALILLKISGLYNLEFQQLKVTHEKRSGHHRVQTLIIV